MGVRLRVKVHEKGFEGQSAKVPHVLVEPLAVTTCATVSGRSGPTDTAKRVQARPQDNTR